MSRRFPILMYHRIGPRDGSFMDEFTVSPETFAAQMQQISSEGWQPLRITAALDRAAQGRSGKFLAITFDDGFASNRQYAWPVLERHGFPSETFIVTERLAQSNLWDGEERANWPLLAYEDLAKPADGLIGFQSHSATHPELNGTVDDRTEIERELTSSKAAIAQLPNGGDGFAYPYGVWNWKVVEAVRAAGFRWACTCLEGRNSSRTNPFLLRRVSVEERDIGARLRIKLLTGRDVLKWPPSRPPEIRLAKEWLRKELAKYGSAFGRTGKSANAADGLSRNLDTR